MKRFNIHTLLLLSLLATVSCTKDEPADDSWRTANEQAFSAIARNPEYTELPSLSNNGSIYYRILRKGEGVKPVYYTSRVQVYYKGWYVAADPLKDITPGKVFDKRLFDDGPPLGVALSSAVSVTGSYSTVIEGWQTALQHMVEGDKWEVWIPCQLAYGEKSTSKNMPDYTTLVFEIEVFRVFGINEF
jgi:peptidylprolyl isomerase/FKBP-type peptidyl-prolyl cis-trans isomerase FklB